MQRALRTFTALGAIALAGVARGQSNDPDLDQLFKERSEPPLIGILFDNSGSMRNVVWNAAEGKFNPKKFYDLVSNYTSNCRRSSSVSLDVPKLANTAKVTTTPKRPGVCVGSGESDDSCPDNERESGAYLTAGQTFECKRSWFTSSSSFDVCGLKPAPPTYVAPPAGKFAIPNPTAAQLWGCESLKVDWPSASNTQTIRFTLPDHTPSGAITQWSKNYLGWIISEIKAGNKPVIPHADRLETMKVVLKNTIRTFNPTTHNEKARFALWGFDQSKTEGSLLHQDFDTSTRISLDTAIDNLVPSNGTPLAESVTEIAQYISGNQAIGQNRDLKVGPITAGNPMQDELCSKSFIVAITDGEPSADTFGHYGNVRVNTTTGKIVTSGGTVMNRFKWAVGDVVGAKEGNANDPSAPPYDPVSLKPPVPPYDLGDPDDADDDGTDWLDDVTYYLSHTDLRPDDAPAADALVDEQTIVSYMIGFNQDHPLLSSAASAGKGKFFTANTADDLTKHLENAIKDILLSSGSFSAVSIPAARTATSDALFTPFFEPSASENFWPGHLQSYRIVDDPNTPEIDFIVADELGKKAIDTDTGDFIEPLGRYIWDAGRCLADSSLTAAPKACYIAAASRNILFNKTKGTPPSTPPTRQDFTAANVTTAELAVTDVAEPSKFPKVYADTTELKGAIVNYVRGLDAFDTDPKDGDFVKPRLAVLGDIFHSSPLLIGGPSSLLASETGFGPLHGPPGVPSGPATFLDDYFKRERLIYVGTNDGMLHAFKSGTLQNPNAVVGDGDEFYTIGTGEEKFGYIANDSLPVLKDLAKIGVAKPYFMDGSPVAADAWFPSTATDTSKDKGEWTTAMISGMRNGGDSVLALDVTDPNAATSLVAHGPFPKPLWEFTYPGATATEAGLGNTWSTPVITRVKLEAGVSGDFCGSADGDGDSDGAGLADAPDCQETWVAIFGGGYLAGGDPSLLSSYIKFGDAGWNPDSRSIFIVRLKDGQLLARAGYEAADTDLKEMKYPIPSTPAVADINGDGFADVVYIGDIGGQMWKWDISAVAKPDPTTKLVSKSTWRAARFFVSPAGTNSHLRQIFYPPSLSFNSGKLTLAFGTGERTNLNYPTLPGTDENHYYVVRDPAPFGGSAFSGLPLGIANLTLLDSLTATDANPTDSGFYFAASKHEKFVTESVAFQGSVIMLSYDPELEGTVEKCGTRGRSLLYMFSLTDGEPTIPDGLVHEGRRLELGGGVPSTPRISTAIEDGTSHIAVQTSRGLFVPDEALAAPDRGVEWLFWREL